MTQRISYQNRLAEIKHHFVLTNLIQSDFT